MSASPPAPTPIRLAPVDTSRADREALAEVSGVVRDGIRVYEGTRPAIRPGKPHDLLPDAMLGSFGPVVERVVFVKWDCRPIAALLKLRPSSAKRLVRTSPAKSPTVYQ
jgi:hypothetical protein